LRGRFACHYRSQDPEELRKKTLEIVKIYLAAGIDPKKCTLFVQSHVKEHTELGWILNTITKMQDLMRMSQFVSKAMKGMDGKRAILKKKIGEQVLEQKVLSAEESEEYLLYKAGVGLFDYPVLMAADILLYDTNIVPVGKDQMQHIELARTLARRFNEKFGEAFVIPEGKLSKEGNYILGLDDPTKKMSKSASSEYNYIALTDDAETVRKKIKKAVTDSGSEIVYSDDKPALKNLINIYTLLSGESIEDIQKKYVGKGYGDFKNDLAEVVVNFLTPFQERLKNISDEEALAVLKEGAKKARILAEAKMKTVRERVGFLSEA